ncbi:carbohydrate ABC transporter permease [Paenibacillus bouchesdurhonensis]|uniref:carbohydrate ABC transporter permease n=1 Tax=Paenibacillus bouchesdurhonensis TaxID=1870990 RepID=UPI000DA5F29A|nr:carbohydrate ABC transporter permease [Paenibacillus bouchesdurhonensis]
MSRHKQISKTINILLGIVMSLFWCYPLYLVITNSFKTKAEIFTNKLGFPSNPTLANYKDAFLALDFYKSFANSLIIACGSVLIICVCTSMAAYALSRRPGKISSIIYFVYALLMLVPFQAIMIPLVSVFGSLDMLNRVGLMIMYLGLASSMSIFLYFGALRGLPKELDEASLIDGSNRFQIYMHIILPLLRPTTVTVIVINVMWFWNDYLLPSIVINKEGLYTIPLKMFYFFGEYTKQWHLALAGLVIAIIPIIIFYMFLQKYIVQGISEGAVK